MTNWNLFEQCTANSGAACLFSCTCNKDKHSIRLIGDFYFFLIVPLSQTFLSFYHTSCETNVHFPCAGPPLKRHLIEKLIALFNVNKILISDFTLFIVLKNYWQKLLFWIMHKKGRIFPSAKGWPFLKWVQITPY